MENRGWNYDIVDQLPLALYTLPPGWTAFGQGVYVQVKDDMCSWLMVGRWFCVNKKHMYYLPINFFI